MKNSTNVYKDTRGEMFIFRDNTSNQDCIQVRTPFESGLNLSQASIQEFTVDAGFFKTFFQRLKFLSVMPEQNYEEISSGC